MSTAAMSGPPQGQIPPWAANMGNQATGTKPTTSPDEPQNLSGISSMLLNRNNAAASARAAGQTAAQTPAAALPAYGSQSGPGIMQQWFNQRATGTDPGWQYAMGRAGTALNNQYAARGMYNSGAATQGLGDMYANAGAQREGQLDTMAQAASGERQGQENAMIGMGMGLAGGQAGLGSAYDLGGANAMSASNAQGLQLGGQAAMLPYMANSQFNNQLMGLATLGLLA